MQTVIVLVGAPGSGKEAWAKKYCEKHSDWVTISLDGLRNMGKAAITTNIASFYIEAELNLVAAALEKHLNVIVNDRYWSSDRMSRLVNTINRVITEAREKEEYIDIACIKKEFKTPLNICLLRNSMKNSPFSEKAVITMYNYFKRKSEESDKTPF